MDTHVEGRIRALAKPLWESAAHPYGMALDCWLMAEQMVLEMMAAAAKMGMSAVGEPPLPDGQEAPPTTVPVHRIRDLAYCMWESAGKQYGMAWDFWLAAEKHVLSMMRAAMKSAGACPVNGDLRPKELLSLSSAEYLQRIRVAAYRRWEMAGRQYGCALDFWLRGERAFLGALATSARDPAPTVENPAPGTLPPNAVDRPTFVATDEPKPVAMVTAGASRATEVHAKDSDPTATTPSSTAGRSVQRRSVGRGRGETKPSRPLPT